MNRYKMYYGYELRIHGGPTHRGITSNPQQRLSQHRRQVGPVCDNEGTDKAYVVTTSQAVGEDSNSHTRLPSAQTQTWTDMGSPT